jgi:poly(A) polymerase
MITKIIKRLLHKSDIKTAKIITKHNINVQHISANALYVVSELQKAGFKAFVVGGAVRDLLLEITPKDFDIATDATPNQVCKIFRKARIIGKRFQIVLVPFYRSREQEIIEITTFRAKLKEDSVVLIKDQSQRPKVSKGVQVSQNSSNKVAMDSSGQVWNDNVWGTHEEDASRRDFTVNALYYNPIDNKLYDFYDGIKDISKQTLRIIGDPATRYKEDPVRMLRLARFMAKTDFILEKSALAPIKEHAILLGNIPPARLSDELLKMLMGGYARACIKNLVKLGLDKHILPWYKVQSKLSQDFIELVLRRTDERLEEGKSVSASFIFASIYWPQLEQIWQKLQPHHPYVESLDLAIAQVIAPLQLQRKTVADMQEIWHLQPRLEKRQKASIMKILEHPRFRAGYDFLVLRSMIDKNLEPLAQWWTMIQELDEEQQQKEIDKLVIPRSSSRGRKPHRRRTRSSSSSSSASNTENKTKAE